MLTATRLTTLDGGAVEIAPDALEALAREVAGPVLRPGTAGFAEAVRIWNGMISARPALVVQPRSPGDVRRALEFARAHGVRLSVKGGGHNVAGTALVDGGMTLDMSRMRRVEVDASRRLAHVGPGCRLGEVDRATQAHGLATVLGFVSETGVAGLTLGGGFGYLTRRFGWAVDNLEEVEVVTADGHLRRAAADEHGDLFWALRGGGGNFGVVTRFTFRLHAVGPLVTGGMVIWDGDQAPEVSALYREAAEAAPRELALGLLLRLAPPLPFIPGHLHGKPVVALLVCHTGDEARAAGDLAPIRAFGRPVADLVARRPYVEQQSLLDASQPDGLHQYWKSEFLGGLTGELLRVVREHGAAISSPMSQAVLFQLGGAAAERDPGDSAFANRDAAYVFFAAGSWPPDAPDGETHRAWARAAWEAVRPHSTGGNYVNAQTADEDDARLTGAYRGNLDRLCRIKAAYDPDNLFRANRNILPARTPIPTG